MARVPDVICAGSCGTLLWASRTSLPEGKAMCRACGASNWSHGTGNGYKRGCRCDECKAWNRQSHYEYTQRRAAGLTPTKPCSLTDCANDAWARQMCRMHYKRWGRANGLEQSPSNKWSDARRSNHHARRARMNGGTTGDRVLQADLLLRDGPTCSACKQHIDIDIPWPDPFSPSVDHTVPISKGGDHSMENCTIMHLRCNMAKGARILDGAEHGTQHLEARQA